MRNRILLREGALVSSDGEDWRITHIEDTERVLAARLRDGRHDFLRIEDLRPPKRLNEHSNGNEANEDETPETGQAKRPLNRRIRRLPEESAQLEPANRDKRDKTVSKTVREFQEIRQVIDAPRRERRRLIAALCKRFGYDRSTAYRRLKIVEVHGSADALMRAVRADAGRGRIAKEVQDAIRSHLKDYRFVSEPKTLPKILELVNGHCRAHGWREISISTLRKFEKEKTLKEKLEAQGRKKKVADAFRPKVGHLPNNDYPLAIVQVDHTPIQICFVDEIDRQPIGDAWLTLVIDTYSRMVLGFYLTFDAPSTLSTGLALAHAFLPKEEYLRSLGVPGEWPCWGFPDLILVDNANELNGHMMHGARRRYRFTLRNRPVGAPNFGGHVESAFRTFMYELKSVPGTKFSNPVERGEYDSEGRAIFTIREFELFFTDFLVNDYHLGKHTGEGMEGTVPYLKWKQGIFEGDVMPPVGLPERPTDPLALRISLMPFERRTVRSGIVNMFSEDYHSGALTLISDAVDLNKPLADRKFEIRYDPRNISRIWLNNNATEDYVELTFADLSKGPISLWEHNARKRRRGDPSAQFKDQRYESMLRREEMKEKAAKRTKQQRLEDEKARLRAQGALMKPPRPSKPLAKPQKTQLGREQLDALRKKVRPAPVLPATRKETDHES
ncbi:MAG: DDE-type integrase/transposase/recombinase [Rhodocyclales bacterium]|nr:DDE-type integrase/transposase/recombinase [Rhodocyclales bacterium]